MHLHRRVESLRSYLEKLNNGSPGRDDSAFDFGNDAIDESFQGDPGVPKTPTLVDELVADIGALPIQTSAYPLSSENPTLSNILLGTAGQSSLSTVLPICRSTGWQPTSYSRALPKKDVALRIAQVYLDNIYPRLPFFSIQGFWIQFNSVFNKDSLEPNLNTLGRPPEQQVDADQEYSIFTVLLVLAIATSSLSRSADSAISSQAQRLFTAALPYRDAAVKPNTIVGVQSLLFLIQYATLNPSILNAWYLVGVGMRTCIDLGLHQDPQPLDSISPSLLETRRRLWWSMYSFDRSFSMGCGRPTEISDIMIDVHLPTFRMESVATQDQVRGYLQRYRVLQIQSEIYDALYKAGDSSATYEIIRDLSERLEAWASDNSPAHSQTLYESELLMGRLLLYRPCRLVPRRTRIETQQLWASAVRFTTLYRQLVESNAIFYIQIAAEKMYWVGLALLYSYWELSRDSTEHPYLLELWKAVQDVLYIIRALADRWEDGSILAREFENTSKEVFTAMEPLGAADGGVAEMPTELAHFATYTSLTSLRAIRTGHADTGSDAELKQLMSDIVTQQSFS